MSLAIIPFVFNLAAAFNPSGAGAFFTEGNRTPADGTKAFAAVVMGIDDILQQVEAAGDPDADRLFGRSGRGRDTDDQLMFGIGEQQGEQSNQFQEEAADRHAKAAEWIKRVKEKWGASSSFGQHRKIKIGVSGTNLATKAPEESIENVKEEQEAVFVKGVEQSEGSLVHESKPKKDRIMFSCTTFLSKPDKRENFEEVLRQLDPVLGDYCERCLIVNEYDESLSDHSDVISNYPKFEFYQKGKDQRGQAASLNIILDELEKGGYDYWVQWEEGWVPKRDFFPDALHIMQRTNIDQMQFSEAWKWLPNRKLEKKDGYLIITKTHDDYPEWQCAEKWPLFSLQPGINRVSSILKCGRFDTDPENWPYQFEYLFALEFVKNKLNKAMIEGGASIRVEGHLSTHKTAEQKAQELEDQKQAIIQILAQGGSVEEIIRRYQEGDIAE